MLEFVVDALLLAITQGIVGWLIGSSIGGVMGESGASDNQIVETVALVVICIATMMNWLYYTLLESSPLQATIGKKVLHLAVTDMYGERIGFGRASARNWAKYLSGLLLGAGYLMAAFDPLHQTLHDKIASTLVLSREK